MRGNFLSLYFIQYVFLLMENIFSLLFYKYSNYTLFCLHYPQLQASPFLSYPILFLSCPIISFLFLFFPLLSFPFLSICFSICYLSFLFPFLSFPILSFLYLSLLFSPNFFSFHSYPSLSYPLLFSPHTSSVSGRFTLLLPPLP